MRKTQAHTVYRSRDGKAVPGVTTIINSNLGWNKNVLVAWARRTALAGEDPDKVRDAAADIGTLAHHLIRCHLLDIKPDTSDYSSNTIDRAENAFLAFLEWESMHRLKALEIEESYVSEVYRYGGTLDLVAQVDQQLALVDFKSSNGVYAEHRIQLAAYLQLRRESYGEALVPHLLQIGKDDGAFHHHRFNSLQREWEVFRCCLRLHQLRPKGR